MRAVMFSEPGGPEVLEIRELPDPEPAAGELLVRVFATALNRADLLQRRGKYPPPPGASEVLGLEFAGEVARVGAGVEGWSVGDSAFGLVPGGGYAELLTLPAELALPIPDTLSFDAAAAVPEAFYTANENLAHHAQLAAGETVLVHGGAGGVGGAAIQLGRAFGARVLATASTDEKAALCEDLGAERVIRYRDEDFAAVVRELTDGAGVDVIFDVVGGSYLEKHVASLARGGRLLVVGLLGGPRGELDMARVLFRKLRISGHTLRDLSLPARREATARFRERVLPRLESGDVRPVLDRVLPLEDVREAHEFMEANRNAGKIVLRM